MKKTGTAIPDRVQKGDVSVPERLRIINRTQPHAVLATESRGYPYTSLVAYALTPDMQSLLFLTPRSTRKYRNILRNNNVSVLIDTRSNTGRDYMGAESLTILGQAFPVKRSKKRSELAAVFLRKHPRLSGVMDSPAVALMRVEIDTCIHVTQFQSVTVWETKRLFKR
jgi:nitroimidazol reductase NimA-like FMN-containing flavoprotein (pyridoxamine 5'-phosphate oxidase superfamily)